MNKDYYNASGCADPTAYKALNKVQHEEVIANVNRLIKALKAAIDANGFILRSRIELKDKETGAIFK